MILDTFLTEMAKNINGETNVVPSHLTYATVTNVVSSGMTSITGEIPVRLVATKARNNTITTLTATRPAASASAEGQPLVNISLWSALTQGTVLSSVSLPTVLQTTSFDVYAEYSIEVARRT